MKHDNTCTEIKPFIVDFLDEETGKKTPAQGFSTINERLSTRLSIVYEPGADVCCVAVTCLEEGQGHHVFIPVEVLDDLIQQLADIIPPKETPNDSE
jgi:hypothetical protein